MIEQLARLKATLTVYVGDTEKWHEAQIALDAVGARLAALEAALRGADRELNPDQGGAPDVPMARYWLRTGYPVDHPNYLTPEYVAGLG